jgi:rhamnogalacturonan endolyase
MKNFFLRRIPTIILVGALFASSSYAQHQMEKLSRGLVGVYTSSGVFLSWRILGTEFSTTSFYVYRDGTKIATIASTANSNYLDASGTASNTYYVVPVVSGTAGTASATVTPWSNIYKSVSLTRPAGGTDLSGVAYTYSPNDCSVGDLDGDGDYELVVKWDPSDSKDNSASGYTAPVYLDAYELDGTLKWRINLGINVRAGAHYTPFLVYDFNGDGKAEVVFRGCPGTTDNAGTVIGGTTDYRNSSGYNLTSPEYLCVASGASGNITKYCTFGPSRGTVSDWGDTYGNRCDRFLAGVAYLDGVTPSIIMTRGYYTGTVSGTTYGQTKIYAYSYLSNTITQKWSFTAVYGGTNAAYVGQGNHQLSCADIDGDGYDEIVYGSCTIDHDGTGKYSTGLGHGDMLNVGVLNPSLSVPTVWAAHEEGSSNGGIIASFRNAKTGAVIWSVSGTGDNGRALSADIDATYPGEECWSTASTTLYNCTGTGYGTAPTICNTSVWWDGDLQREILDGTKLDKWVAGSTNRLVTLYNYGSSASNNSTKSNPCLTADIFGDWREEIILASSTGDAVNIFTTTTVSSTRMYTLMHDYQYRTGVAAENAGYNSTPRLSFYFGGGMSAITAPSVTLKSAVASEEILTTVVVTKASLSVWPNPVSSDEDFKVKFFIPCHSEVTAEIVDLTGKQVLKRKLGVFEAGSVEQIVDISTVSKGMYILRLQTASGILTTKFSKL